MKRRLRLPVTMVVSYFMVKQSLYNIYDEDFTFKPVAAYTRKVLVQKFRRFRYFRLFLHLNNVKKGSFFRSTVKLHRH